jgi:hypothetical protein
MSVAATYGLTLWRYTLARVRATDWINGREKVRNLVTLAKFCEGNDRQASSMRILPTVLADAGRVALDVSRIERCAVEGRHEDEYRDLTKIATGA